ncbi:extracellular solute-binding protein [Sphingomonas sp. MG17]|uniref:Extracellular solute-binding protein n=1 Tax=Sphingomonas tagetis TaxID=2949092 RepID=A0A9X2HLI5_9SPHN|nr:extracellular solute-binding protein [Sphingomonas tagetis]MCP3729468.1 extracellular solute-binding protein [Sphingomonas tagetis]
MSAPSYRGLTWDHPRGYNALAAAAARAGDVLIAWEKQPLEGFESHPIADLCARYDLVVLDHPHVGEAVAGDCLMPVEDLFGADEIAAWRAAVAGPSLASYHYSGRHWALPLDAATQVMAYRRDTIARPPANWTELPDFAAQHKVALSLAGPHTILSFQSICGALGAGRAGDDFVDRAIAREAFALMAALTGDVTVRAQGLNPIAMLGAIERGEGIDLCPLIYGYVNYATRGVGFADAPAGPGGRIGSTLGGTGIAVSRRCEVTPALLDHLRWLMSDAVQRGFIPQHDGQPALRSAWQDAAVNAATGNFFADTLATVEAALLRPRHDGAIAFQTAASARLRAALLSGETADPVLDDIEALYRTHHPAGAET